MSPKKVEESGYLDLSSALLMSKGCFFLGATQTFFLFEDHRKFFPASEYCETG